MYQHSAVGRDLLVGILQSLGADALPMERSDAFVPIDTEDITDERLLELERLARVARDTIGEIDAIVSTDGDSDRPLVVGIADDGKVCFFGGDLLGILVADYLRADAVVVPGERDRRRRSVVRATGHSREADPHRLPLRHRRHGGASRPLRVPAYRGLRSERRLSHRLGSRARRRGGSPPFPRATPCFPFSRCCTRSVERNRSLPELFSELPPRFGKAGLIDGFPARASRAILKRFSSEADARELSLYFTPELGFGRIVRSDRTDGIRLFFEGGDIAHIRPSGNAPQLRIYAVAGTQERANEIVKLALAEPFGILRKLERENVPPTEGLGGRAISRGESE